MPCLVRSQLIYIDTSLIKPSYLLEYSYYRLDCTGAFLRLMFRSDS